MSKICSTYDTTPKFKTVDMSINEHLLKFLLKFPKTLSNSVGVGGAKVHRLPLLQ